ncbi:hypothetical protein scyTo_0023223, partial [Scyliorhinus torazame]|nr:hypothetical protein [Scyliorhinus torazame]
EKTPWDGRTGTSKGLIFQFQQIQTSREVWLRAESQGTEFGLENQRGARNPQPARFCV